MPDEQNQNQPAASSTVAEPTVMPQAQPKDMFADVDEQEPTVMPTAMPRAGAPEAPAEGYTFEEEEPKPWYMQKKFIVLLLGVVMLLIVVIFGVQFAMRLLAPTAQQPSAVPAPTQTTTPPLIEEQQVPTGTEQTETTQETPTPEPATPTEPIGGQQPTVPEVDTDSDGLTDAEEQALGTSITVADTDGDGLSDREEFRVFGTDPKNPDTDGDTYLDGVEVQNGYNPRGEGKLFTIPTE